MLLIEKQCGIAKIGNVSFSLFTLRNENLIRKETNRKTLPVTKTHLIY